MSNIRYKQRIARNLVTSFNGAVRNLACASVFSEAEGGRRYVGDTASDSGNPFSRAAFEYQRPESFTVRFCVV